mmetsp:Transcript_14261/g.21339  ORF Transcript_14261/g.21339 Transcript_14261/m.21339 type:complete len:158 (-) Transcript_14261:883-1356(-)
MSSKVVSDAEPIYLPLLNNETTSDFLSLASISTATVYTGTAPDEFIRTRLNDIIQLNPWIEGRLVKYKGKIVLKYSSCPVMSTYDIITQEDLPSIHTNDNLDWLIHYEVKKGSELVNKDEPIFKLTLVHMEAEKFAIVMSLSHVVGDGDTFYQCIAC